MSSGTDDERAEKAVRADLANQDNAIHVLQGRVTQLEQRFASVEAKIDELAQERRQLREELVSIGDYIRSKTG